MLSSHELRNTPNLGWALSFPGSGTRLSKGCAYGFDVITLLDMVETS